MEAIAKTVKNARDARSFLIHLTLHAYCILPFTNRAGGQGNAKRAVLCQEEGSPKI